MESACARFVPARQETELLSCCQGSEITHGALPGNRGKSRSRRSAGACSGEKRGDLRFQKLAGRGNFAPGAAPDGGSHRGRNVPPAGKVRRRFSGMAQRRNMSPDLKRRWNASFTTRDSFTHTSGQDGPNAHYSDHTHPGETAHIILDGEMTLTHAGTTQTYTAGERCDVPTGAVHSRAHGRHWLPVPLIGEK